LEVNDYATRQKPQEWQNSTEIEGKAAKKSDKSSEQPI
jgi:hypothetical protein